MTVRMCSLYVRLYLHGLLLNAHKVFSFEHMTSSHTTINHLEAHGVGYSGAWSTHQHANTTKTTVILIHRQTHLHLDLVRAHMHTGNLLPFVEQPCICKTKQPLQPQATPVVMQLPYLGALHCWSMLHSCWLSTQTCSCATTRQVL